MGLAIVVREQPSVFYAHSFRVHDFFGRSLTTTGMYISKTNQSQLEVTDMTHVVTKNCFGCKYTDCVVVCPCECFREGEQMLYIAPNECIDCRACAVECPVEAIFHEDDVPAECQDFLALNAQMAAVCSPIIRQKPPLARP